MSKRSWNLWDDWEAFDLANSGATPGEYQGRKALYLEKIGEPVFLKEEIPFESFRLKAEVAIPPQVAFVGLVFGARDSQNYELIYLAPQEIQYDPVMNNSMTWQIYNGPSYQKPLPNTTGKWMNLCVEVHPNGASVYLNENAAPELIIPNLQHGGSLGKIGFWGYLSCYIRNLSVEEITPSLITHPRTDIKKLMDETYLTEWMVSSPFVSQEKLTAVHQWSKAQVEENGTLNINRLYPAESGVSVLVESTFTILEETETELSFGFSDQVRLWVNDVEVYQGAWRWAPPGIDGRIRSDYASLPVRWKAGINIIRAELTNHEQFGWGLKMKTGLSDMSLFTEEQ